MTISRFITISCLCCLLLPKLSGQQGDSLLNEEPLSESPLIQAGVMQVDAPGDELEIPNVFTPNGDQVNDYFEVETDGTTVYEFSVFTRAGTRIYYSKSPRIFWDGNSLEGKELKAGIYYYVIDEEGGSDPFGKTGFMYLYR
jgi:gliding motility-associated-like protein